MRGKNLGTTFGNLLNGVLCFPIVLTLIAEMFQNVPYRYITDPADIWEHFFHYWQPSIFSEKGGTFGNVSGNLGSPLHL